MVVDWLKSQHECDVLYGGSVSANNLASILATGADGALVGGASLDVEQFNKMVDICIQSFSVSLFCLRCIGRLSAGPARQRR
jgi:triosephosphate isomerase